MLPIKLERAIFIIIFIVCLQACVIFTSQVKANELPINKGMTPEQVIESEYIKQSGNLNYKYIIMGNIMFVCHEESPGFCSLGVAFRNPSSGFMFKVPGLFSWPIRNERNSYIDTGDAYMLGYTIGIYSSGYYIVIYDTFKKRDIDFYIDKKEMDMLELDNNTQRYWVGVINDLSDFNEVIGNYNSKQIHIIDAKELKAIFGEG
jgi:hypothetical protein